METKHNCPYCHKELTLENGEFYCKGENPYHIYYSTPEELKLHQEFYDNFWRRALFPDHCEWKYPLTPEEAFNNVDWVNAREPLQEELDYAVKYNKDLNKSVTNYMQTQFDILSDLPHMKLRMIKSLLETNKNITKEEAINLLDLAASYIEEVLNK